MGTLSTDINIVNTGNDRRAADAKTAIKSSFKLITFHQNYLLSPLFFLLALSFSFLPPRFPTLSIFIPMLHLNVLGDPGIGVRVLGMEGPGWRNRIWNFFFKQSCFRLQTGGVQGCKEIYV